MISNLRSDRSAAIAGRPAVVRRSVRRVRSDISAFPRYIRSSESATLRGRRASTPCTSLEPHFVRRGSGIFGFYGTAGIGSRSPARHLKSAHAGQGGRQRPESSQPPRGNPAPRGTGTRVCIRKMNSVAEAGDFVSTASLRASPAAESESGRAPKRPAHGRPRHRYLSGGTGAPGSDRSVSCGQPQPGAARWHADRARGPVWKPCCSRIRPSHRR